MFDHNDRLQEALGAPCSAQVIVQPWSPTARHPQAFVDACLAGLGQWGMNPLHLVQAHLQSGSLVGVGARPSAGCAPNVLAVRHPGHCPR